MKLYCVFIDIEKVFDFVWYIGLWNKVLLNNIDGKCFKIIINMYKGIKIKYWIKFLKIEREISSLKSYFLKSFFVF